MMGNKRLLGVTIFSSLYLCCGAPFLFFILFILFSFFKTLLFPNQADAHCGTPASLIFLVLLNLIVPAAILYLMIMVSIGLLKLSNNIRLQMLVGNKIFFVLFLIGVIYAYLLPIAQNYKVLVIGLLGILLVFLSASTYYFTRPQVKEQFK
jgi:hypothetical protein